MNTDNLVERVVRSIVVGIVTGVIVGLLVFVVSALIPGDNTFNASFWGLIAGILAAIYHFVTGGRTRV